MRPLCLAVLLSAVPVLCAQSPRLAPADAIRHVGERATVCGPIADRRTGAVVHGLPTFIDLGRASPAPSFTIILWNSDAPNVGDFPSSGDVCVTGTITQYKGVPQMVLYNSTDWSVDRGGIASPAATRPVVADPAPAPGPPAAPLHPVAAPVHPAAVPARPAAAPARPIPLRPSPAPASSLPAASALVATSHATASPPANPPATDRADPPVADPPDSSLSASALARVPPSPIASYRIGADDSLQITVWKEPNLSGNFLVRPDGMISLVLAGEVRAAGLTPIALSDELTQRFRKYLQDPLVSVIVVAPNSQKIYLLGEVQHVGPVAMATAMSPLQAIAAAGGLTPYAKPKKIYILRGPQGSQRKIPFNYKNAVNAKPSSSVRLLAGDTIVVP